MEIVRFAAAAEYTLPDHEQVTAKRLQGGDASTAGFALVGHSLFPAGAVVPLGAAPIGRIYVVVEGALSVRRPPTACAIASRGGTASSCLRARRGQSSTTAMRPRSSWWSRHRRPPNRRRIRFEARRQSLYWRTSSETTATSFGLDKSEARKPSS